MRRRITLYLGGQLADLSDDAFVLLNVAVTDVTNPAAVRNSWTQEIELPRTPANEAIFGHSGRLDRLAGSGGTGTDFNASRRLPFQIYRETGEILFAGYAKLNAVTRDAYSVTLYGGLGEFIYGLSYDTAGNKRSLADLDYGVTLDFVIDATAVTDAWARLGGDTSKDPKWDVINFAPAYDGIPSDFKADKALIDPADLGVTTPVTEDGISYDATRTGGYALLNLPQPVDGWQARDLRSYLQRPVISVGKILDAIADPDYNGGWNVDLTAIAALPYRDAWLTRPLLPSLGTYKQQDVGATVSYVSGAWVTSNPAATASVTDAPVGSKITVRLEFDIWFDLPGATEPVMRPYLPAGHGISEHNLVTFVQLVAYDSNNVKVGASVSKPMMHHNNGINPSKLAAACGYTPDSLNTAFSAPEHEYDYDDEGMGYYSRRTPVHLTVSGVDIDRVEVNIETFVALIDSNGSVMSGYAGGSFWDIYGDEYPINAYSAPIGSGTATGTTGESLRSGATVTKEMLLSTSKTPAEYLLALCKAFGLVILADGAARTVQILPREDFYQNDVFDLTGRVDAPSAEIRPLAFDSKWYDLKHPSVGGAFEKEYLQTEGVQYGIQRIDTGYNFDADEKDLLSGSALKSCAAVQDRGAWWYLVTDGAVYFPPPMTSPGGSYTLWDTDGNNLDTDFYTPADAASFTPYNATFPGYDVASRAEFRDAKDNPVDGADVLLFHGGADTLLHFNVTDDLAAMDTVVGGPCWLMAVNNVGVDVPQFTRYTVDGNGDPDVLLDFGIPRQIDIPGLDYAAGSSVYDARWRAYIEDRLSVHGKTMKAKVLLEGLQVGPGLLRRFYWYGGSLWALVSVSNYSLTTFDPAECEFVQVRDINAYL